MYISGINTVIFGAAQAEFGAASKAAGVTPELIGVGPIEATFNATRFVEKAIADGKKPDIIFSIGSAGSAKLPQGELFQISAVSYRDMDASPFGFERGLTPFVDYPAVFETPVLLQDLPTATLSTGAAIITKQGGPGKNFDDIPEDTVDMETYALLRVGLGYNIPVVCLRGISDGAEVPEGLSCWEKYLTVIDEKIAAYFTTLKEKPAGLIRLASEAKAA